MSQLSRVISILSTFLIFMSGAASAQEVERIEISVLYGVWHEDTGPISPSVQIERKQDGYFLCFPDNSKNCTQPIDKNLVQRLVEAAIQPPLEHLDISRLGITQGGLNARAEQAYQAKKEGLESEWTPARCEPPVCSGSTYKQIFLENYTNMEEIDHQLKRYYYDMFWAHASLGFSVSLIFKNGDTWFLTSFNQRYFLLPWTVQRSGKRFETYAPDIARAVYDLLPETHLTQPNNNRDRALYALQANRKWLAGDLYKLWADDFLIYPVTRELSTVKASRSLGEKTRIIQSQFNILAMSINGRNKMGLFDFGGLWEKKGILPKVKIEISSPINLIETDNVANLVQQTNARIQRILDIKWFREWLEENKSDIDHWRIDINNPDREYNTVDWVILFLKINKLETWKSKIEKQRDKIVSITIEHEALPAKGYGKFSKLLVFPNGEMILWNTNMEKLHTWDSSNYGFLFSKDTGRLGRDDGMINYVAHFDSQGHLTVDYRGPSSPCYFLPPFKRHYSYVVDCLKK